MTRSCRYKISKFLSDFSFCIPCNLLFGSAVQLDIINHPGYATDQNSTFRYRPEVDATTHTSGLEVRSIWDLMSNISVTPETGTSELSELVVVNGHYVGFESLTTGSIRSRDMEVQSFETRIFNCDWRSETLSRTIWQRWPDVDIASGFGDMGVQKRHFRVF